MAVVVYCHSCCCYRCLQNKRCCYCCWLLLFHWCFNNKQQQKHCLFCKHRYCFYCNQSVINKQQLFSLSLLWALLFLCQLLASQQPTTVDNNQQQWTTSIKDQITTSGNNNGNQPEAVTMTTTGTAPVALLLKSYTLELKHQLNLAIASCCA